MKSIISVLLCLLAITLYSQDLPDLKAYSKDIGFNTNFLFDGIFNTTGSPFDLMLKKQKMSHLANRFGLSLYANISTNTRNGSGYNYKYDNYSLSLSFGKEKQNQLSKRWIFYYGADLAPFYLHYKNGFYYDNQLQNESTNEEIGLQVSPFLGIRFQINDRLYVATEAIFRLAYSLNKTSSKSYDNTNMLINEASQKFNNVDVQALPARGISIFYRF
jgi:hypothetical protein